MSANLLEKTSLEQAKLIVRREISCEELTRLYLDRIASHNEHIQAFVDFFPERALTDARRKDALVQAGEPLPTFHGVPIGIKDLHLVKGMRTRFGSRAFIPSFPSPIDDATVAPLRRAGFVILGKLATSELGAIPITEPDIRPPTRNPWNTDHTPGGSSGGSAAAVAGGLLPIAEGTDGGGSIRIPASFNGLVGLKPARGRLINQFKLADRNIIYTSGVLTRTVDETAELLDIMAGITSGTPHWATPPSETFARLAKKKPGRQRIRMTLDSPIVKVDPEVRDAVASVAKTLAGLGHEIVDVAYPEVTVHEFLPLWQFMIAHTPLMRWSVAQPITRWLREGGRKLKADDVLALHRQLEARLLAWAGTTDLWLTPTVGVLPPRVGSYSQNADPETVFHEVAKIGAFTASANVTGQPAISIPGGVSKSGLPIGVQLTGPVQSEALLLQVAKQLEEARPWRHSASLLS